MAQDSSLTSAKGLGARGWTPSLIEQVLGQPDYTAANPHYVSAGTPARLYETARVERAEAIPEVQERLQRRAWPGEALPESVREQVDAVFRGYPPIDAGRAPVETVRSRQEAMTLHLLGIPA